MIRALVVAAAIAQAMPAKHPGGPPRKPPRCGLTPPNRTDLPCLLEPMHVGLHAAGGWSWWGGLVFDRPRPRMALRRGHL